MGLNNVTEAFEDWLETVTGKRTPGEYVLGRWVDGTAVDLSFSGVVQNADPDDLVVLSEGNREREAIKIHTVFRLLPQTDGQTGDIVYYDDDEWLVYSVARRIIGGYHKALALKI